MKKITLYIFILSFLLYRPYKLQEHGLNYQGDDDAYFSHATSLAYFEFPSYKKELVNNPRYGIGAGLMAAPFVFVFSIIDRIFNSDITIDRSNDDINKKSWTLFGFIFSSIFYFWFSCLILYKALRYYFNEYYSVITITLMVLLQGVPLYVYRRPFFAHIYEFFLQSLLILFLCYTNNSANDEKEGFLKYFIVCFIIGLVPLVRYNNGLVALLWPVAIWGVRNSKFVILENWKKITISYLILSIPVIFFFVSPELYYSRTTTFSYILELLHGRIINLQNLELSFYAKRFVHVLFGLDWGVIFTAPFILFSLISFFYLKGNFRKALVLPLIPVAINFFLFVLSWSSQGSWYGYRYVIFITIPVLIIPFANLIKHYHELYGKKIFFPIAIIAILPLFSMLCFEGNANNLTIAMAASHQWKWLGFTNPTYQLEVWKTFLFDPEGFMIAVFKGGPLYIVYLVNVIFEISHFLPVVVFDKYPNFDMNVVVKSLMIYCSPFLFYFIYKKSKNFKWRIKMLIGKFMNVKINA